MIKHISLKQIFIQKNRPSLNIKFYVSSSNQPPNLKFPYKFSGLSQYSFMESHDSYQFLVKIFNDQQIKKKLISNYRKYLQALQKKDITYLQKIVEGHLLSNIENWPKVSLLNRDAPVEVAIERNIFVDKLLFDRRFNSEQMIEKPNTGKMKQALDFYEGYSLNSDQKQIYNLFITRVYFKSTMKLIIGENSQKKVDNVNQQKSNIQSNTNKQRQRQLTKQQVHMIQFQIPNQTTKFKLFVRRLVTKLLNRKDKSKVKQQIIRALIGASPNSNWKIGDVDKILNGNLPQITKNNMDLKKQKNGTKKQNH